jgi:hypothetical protein
VPSLSPILFLPEDGSRASLRNVFKEKHWTMDKVLKQDSSKRITPSSEPFRKDSGIAEWFFVSVFFFDEA